MKINKNWCAPHVVMCKTKTMWNTQTLVQHCRKLRRTSWRIITWHAPVHTKIRCVNNSNMNKFNDTNKIAFVIMYIYENNINLILKIFKSQGSWLFWNLLLHIIKINKIKKIFRCSFVINNSIVNWWNYFLYFY